MSEVDRSDPAVRAEAAFRGARAAERGVRVATALALGFVAFVAPFGASAGGEGATVGAVVAALVLVALAVALWPHERTSDEERHHRLEAIWREVRTDADAHTPWDRYAAWVENSGTGVELVLIHCAPVGERVGGAPSPFSRRVHRRLDADDVGSAAEAMEKLRAKAMELEERAREQYKAGLADADRRAHEETLRAVDEAAESYQREADERARRELAEQEAAEQKAQAEALARALRRP